MSQKRMTKRQADTYRARLMKLATFLRTVPPRRFNYGTWVGDDWKGASDLSCGTTACALGWATTMPEFRRLGLRMSPIAEEGDFAYPICKDGDGDYREDVESATVVFGLNEQEARFLFIPDMEGFDKYSGLLETATAKQVARHIENFVKGWKPELEEKI